MTQTDLIIIGAGPGGYRAAEYAAKQGLKVVIFEGDEVGGTCLNVGCIPTKTFVHSASFDEARERLGQVVPQLRQGIEGILSTSNISLVRDKARFVDTQTVEASHTGEVWRGANIIIATGSETKLIPVQGLDDPRLVDSTGLLSLEKQPRRLCIIGAGVIGMEFASAFQRFGSEVTVIEFLKECLPALDSDIAKRLRKTLEKKGITFKMKTAVQNLADIDADVILMAAGRKPRTEGLNLEVLDITLAPNGAIPVNENYQLSTLNSQLSTVYAIGDVNGKQMLAHAAEMQAIHAVNHILGKNDSIRFDIMPAAIFTTPEAACVGASEDQLKEQGVPYECRKAFYRANGKALAMNESEGLLKLFSEPNAGKILGCHVFGAHSADLAQEASVLMCLGTTIEQLRDMVHIHPTLSEILFAAAES
ncbi:MAG: NAD(P)/FAD-dependent oxidoreductase [Bacteroidaceae bacterium]|nr:NAD(P)/FAD-dependent oxidoreductase [Bacteroidaceae bacterium]